MNFSEIVNSLSKLSRILVEMNNQIINMRDELTSLTDIVEKEFFKQIQKDIDKSE